MKHVFSLYRWPALVLAAAAVAAPTPPAIALLAPAPAPAAQDARPTAAEAQAFVEEASRRLLDLAIRASRAQWVQVNFITHDTEILAAQANEALLAASIELAQQAT